MVPRRSRQAQVDGSMGVQGSLLEGSLRSLAVIFKEEYVFIVQGGRSWERKREMAHGFVAQP